MGEKRVTQQVASDEIYNDDWFLKDSVLHDTTKVQPSVIKEYMNQGMATSQNLADEATARQQADTQLASGIGQQMSNLADFYDTTKSYVVGDVVMQQSGDLLRCIAPTSGAFDITKWEPVTVDELFDDLNFSADAISYDNTSSGLEAENVQDAIDETITKLSAVGTASGDIATFNDGSDLPMPKLEVAIEPVQDLHGYDAPWVGGAGKNKLNINNLSNFSNRGIDFVVAKNSSNAVISVSANGTVIGGTYSDYYIVGASDVYDYANIPSGSYILNGAVSSNAQIYIVSENDGVVVYSNGGDTSAFNMDSSKKYRIFLRISGSVSNVKFYPMIRLASVTDATFAPYSNICPISGHTGVDAWVASKNLVNWKWNTFNDGKMEIFLKGGTYTLSAESTLPNGNAYIRGIKPSGEYVSREELGLTDWGASSTSGVYYGGGGQQTYTFNVPNGGAKIEFGKLNNNGTINAQLELSETATTYEPYNGHTYTIDLNGTRYGGKVDLVSGVLTVDRAYFKYINVSTTSGTAVTDGWRCNFTCPTDDINRGKWNIQTGAIPIFNKISSVAKGYGANEYTVTLPNVTSKQEADAMLEGLEICYKLATPLTIQLTPTVVKSLVGQNNVWADTGEILDAEYIRDLTIALSNSGGGTTYTAGNNIQISAQNVISATDTKYTAGTGISISGSNVISNSQNVTANPSGTVTNELKKLQIGSAIFSIPGVRDYYLQRGDIGGGGSTTLPSINLAKNLTAGLYLIVVNDPVNTVTNVRWLTWNNSMTTLNLSIPKDGARIDFTLNNTNGTVTATWYTGDYRSIYLSIIKLDGF